MLKTACLVPIAIALALLFAVNDALADNVAAGTTRLLQQRRSEEIEITRQNVRRLDRLVTEAERDTVFVFTEDVQLPSVIEVDTPRLTFRGDPDTRPNLTCAEGEEGLLIHANNIVVQDLILRDCSQTAMRIFDKGAGCEDNPFDPDCEQRPRQRLDITLTNVDFIDNRGTEDQSTAGGLAAAVLVHAEIQNCRFENNSGISGGAISFGGSSLRIENSKFIDNVAKSTGGAIFALRDLDLEEGAAQPSTEISIVSTEFTGNNALRGGRDPSRLTVTGGIDLESNIYLDFPLPSPSGGGIYAADFDEVTIESCTFRANHAVPAGGAIYLGDNKKLRIQSCAFNDNYVEPPEKTMDALDLQLGGAIFAAFADTESGLQIDDCVFDGNSAVYGGALHHVGPIEEVFGLNRCRFNNNSAMLGGGAIVFRNILGPEVLFSQFTNNKAFVGGAIFVTNGGGVRLSEGVSDNLATRFEDNVAFDGGAVFGIGSGTVWVHRVFFERNNAERNGGALCFIDAKAGGDLRIQDARMYNNSAETGGAVYVESVSTVFMTVGATDVNAEALGIEDPPRGEFFRNSAVSGGAIYYKASNLVLNNFLLDGCIFSDNAVVANLSSVFPEALDFPRGVSQSSRRLFQTEEKVDTVESSEMSLLDPTGPGPCHPGGGGAVCMVLSGISNRAPVSVQIFRNRFTRNAALVGGAMMISTEENIDWRSDCPPSRDQTATLLTSDPCRELNLRALMFERNQAQFAGGALLVSNLSHVHYSDVAEDDKDFNYRPLNEAKTSDDFVRNRVGRGGYGQEIAGAAVRLSIRHPKVNATTGLLIANQSSGQVHPLPPIEVQVLDGLDQVVSDGIMDASLRIRVDAVRPDTNQSIAAGQVVSTASNGLAVFDALTLSAFPGQYEIVFSVRGGNVKTVSADVSLRDCRLGERYNTDGFVCEACTFESFTFYVDVPRCADCPDNARCSGNASLIPASGYWHSSPFSVIMHECFHDDACAYDNRQSVLETMRSAQIQEFLDRFDQQDTPVFTNEEYSQCATGYEGPLCGSCEDGYGHADGKTCIKCNSKSATAAVIFLLAVWQLMFLAVTIRSALVSIRDMNQMMVIAQQQAAAAAASAPARTNQAPRRSTTFMVPQYDSMTPDPTTPTQRLSTDVSRSEIEAQFARSLSTVASVPAATPAPLPIQVSPKQQLSADYIIAAQHVSETIKIFVNFFQVTSIAVNINLEWTSTIKNMLAGMNSVAGFSNGATFTPMTCLLDSDSDIRTVYGVVLRVAFPLFLMLLAMCVFMARWLAMHRSPVTTRAACQQFLRSRLIICFLVVGFFAYQSISEDLMGTISCIRLDSGDMSEAKRFDDLSRGISYSHFSIADGRYWTEDTNIKCFSRNHAFLVGFLGIPGIVLFLCGVPLYLLIFLLYKRQRNQLMELNVLNTYGFIYQNYEDKFVYWEVCILIRKALIGAIVVFAYPLGANLQGVMALGVLIFSLAIHLIAVPFKYLPLNILEGCSLVVSIFTFYSGVVFNDANTSDDAKVLLSVILMVVNSLLMVVILFTVFVYGDKYVVAKLKFLDVTDIPGNPISRMILLAYILQDRVKTLVTATVHRTFQRSASQRQRTRHRAGTAQMTTIPVANVGSSQANPVSPPKSSADAVIDVTADSDAQL